MRLLKFAAIAMASAAMILALPACGGGDSDDEPIPEPSPIPSPEPVTETLSPEDAKEYVEDSAIEFISLFNANDQRELADLSEYVANNYADLDIPSNWDADDRSLAPADFTRAMAKAYASRSASTVTRAALIYRLSDYAGVYEPGTRSWVKTADSKDVIFRFNGPKGACELKASPSQGEWDLDYEDEYYPEDNFTVKIPSRITITLTEGTQSYVEIVADTKADINARTAKVDINARLMNIQATIAASASNSEISESQTLSVNGTLYQTSTARLRGSKMLDDSTIERLEDEDIELGDVIKSAEASINLMGRIQIRANASNFTRIAEAIETNDITDSWNGDLTESEAEALCRRACRNLNSDISAKVFFGGTDIEQARLTFIPVYEGSPYGYYWYWEIGAALLYSDGSTQTLEDFEDMNFGSVERQWRSVIKAYERLWDIF
ncbi:MAG: hypothetical protein NC418_11610 [Muribaculaceae bacterium]|nr:hypothetical protein [Muribaculaceae bacterium]